MLDETDSTWRGIAAKMAVYGRYFRIVEVGSHRQAQTIRMPLLRRSQMTGVSCASVRRTSDELGFVLKYPGAQIVEQSTRNPNNGAFRDAGEHPSLSSNGKVALEAGATLTGMALSRLNVRRTVSTKSSWPIRFRELFLTEPTTGQVGLPYGYDSDNKAEVYAAPDYAGPYSGGSSMPRNFLSCVGHGW